MSESNRQQLLLRLIEEQRIREEELEPVVARGNFDWVSDYKRNKYSLAVSAAIGEETTPTFAILENGEVLGQTTFTHEELTQLRNYIDLLLIG